MKASGQRHSPSTLPPPPRERHAVPSTHCTGGWVGPRTSLGGCGKTRPHWDSILGSCGLWRESLYRLRCRWGRRFGDSVFRSWVRPRAVCTACRRVNSPPVVGIDAVSSRLHLLGGRHRIWKRDVLLNFLFVLFLVVCVPCASCLLRAGFGTRT
jgi:hypothetical protein